MTAEEERATFAARAARFGRTAETFLLALVLSAMIALAAAQIVLRNVWGTGFGWADEALRIMVLWTTMLGAVAASGERRHVSIDALSRYLPAALARWAAVLACVFTTVVAAVLAWCSYGFVADSLGAGDRVLGGEFPAWTVQLILPVGFALIGCRYAFLSVAVWREPAAPVITD